MGEKNLESSQSQRNSETNAHTYKASFLVRCPVTPCIYLVQLPCITMSMALAVKEKQMQIPQNSRLIDKREKTRLVGSKLLNSLNGYKILSRRLSLYPG